MAAARGSTETQVIKPLDKQKLPPDELICCTEEPDVGFQLWLGVRPQPFGRFAMLTTPQLGVYNSADYSPFLPMVTVSLPLLPLHSGVAQLPASISAVLSAAQARGVVGDDIDLYAIVHSAYIPRGCQHKDCGNRDEVSLMLHPWVFAEDDTAGISGGAEVVARVHMGVFEAQGVRPVHSDLADGGIPFGMLSARSVIAHDGMFSPNNGQCQLDGSTEVAVFFTVALDRTIQRGVITLHALPTNDKVADELRAAIRGVPTLGALITALSAPLPSFTKHLAALVAPI